MNDLPVRFLTRSLMTMMIRAFRMLMKTANRIPRSPALLPKCRIQANRSCGLTTVLLLSRTKKRTSSRNTPRSNLLNPQRPIRGNVGSDDFRRLPWTFLQDLTMLICVLAITSPLLSFS